MAKQIIENKKKQSEPVASTPMNNKPQYVEMGEPTAEILPKDRTSAAGKFGWTRFDDKFVPYLWRYEKEYVALQMMECAVFCNYDHIFNQEIYSCLKVEEFKMTAVEAKLLNEINYMHCDNSFGSFVYPERNCLITVKDAMEILEFLRFCYNKLVLKNTNTSKLCGFVRINSQNFVPYVWLTYRQYVPLFYFDGECRYLEDNSVELEGRELAYIKLLCKIQGVRKSLFDYQSIRIVDLELVKKFFPPGTPFEEFWPTENKISSLLIFPTQRPSSHGSNQENILETAQTKVTPRLQNGISTTNLVCCSKYPPTNLKVPEGRPSPYIANKPVRTTKVNSKILDNCKSSPQYTKYSSIPDSTRPQPPYSQPPPPYPEPPLPYPEPAVPNPVFSATNLNTPTRLHEFPDKNNIYKTHQIPDFPLRHGERPYFLSRSQIGKTFLTYCINLLPHSSAILLVTVEEVAGILFKVPLASLAKVIKYLQLNVYLPNENQMKVFQAYGICPSLGLVALNDLMKNIDSIRMLLYTA